MKLLLGTVSIIAVLTVDGRNSPDDYGALDSAPGETEGYNAAEADPEATLSIQDYIRENNANHFYSNTTGHIIPRKAGCKAKDICIIMGGSCVTNATLCGGRLVPGCKGKNCKCCVTGTLETKINNLEQKLHTMQVNLTEANSNLNVELQTLKDNLTDADSKFSKEFQSLSDNLNNSLSNMVSKMDSFMRRCPVGFFHTAGSSQCYKFYNDTRRSYSDAKGKCQAQGLVLAEPTNPISLRKYLVETFATKTSYAHVHLGALGTGSNFRWERSGRQISNTDALWYSGHPGKSVSTSYCLLLLVQKSYMSSYPYQPYYSGSCSSKRDTLCEYV